LFLVWTRVRIPPAPLSYYQKKVKTPVNDSLQGFFGIGETQVGIPGPGTDILSDFVGTGDGDGAGSAGIHHGTKKRLV